jgi:alcohol dehydrogenase class IV
MFKKIQALQKVAKTVTSPITHAKNVIKSTFTKPTKPKIGGTKKADKIKEAVGIKKKVEKLEKQSEAGIKKGKEMLSRSDMVGPTKNLRDIKRTKRDADKFVKETLKQDFKKGGPVKKKKKKKKFPDLTGDGKVTFADVLKGRGVINGKKKKKKVI